MTNNYGLVARKIKKLVRNKFGVSLKVLVDGNGRVSFSMSKGMLEMSGGKVRILSMVSGAVGAAFQCHMFSQPTYLEDGSEGEEFVLQMLD